MSNVVEKRLRIWKDKLIDLSKRNRLLNFRATKVTTVRIIDEIPSEIFKIVVIDKSSMKFKHIISDEDKESSQDETEPAKSTIDLEVYDFQSYDSDGLEEKHTDVYLQTPLEKVRLNKNLLRISSKASSVMEEQGYNVLFLALGCLEWYESENSNIKLKAPIVLTPVELRRKSVKSPFQLNYTEETIMINPALIQKLFVDFGIKIKPLNEEVEQIDPQSIFTDIQESIKNMKNWRVTNDIYLSLFSFAKFIMYKDLETFMDKLLNNSIIQAICGQKIESDAFLDLLWEPKEIESSFQPLKTFQVLDADSSQQQAILAIKRGRNLLIEGPPGTGKSQTIANIISECLAEKKRVLFVSQKMAALEVVKQRLENVGLGDYCLELHSRKTDKKQVIKELVRTLELQKKPDHDHDEELLKLEKLRNELNAYVQELHSPFGQLEMTPYQAFGVANACQNIEDLGFVFKDAKDWSRRQYNHCCDLLDRLGDSLTQVKNLDTHPWRGSKLTELAYQEKLSLLEVMDKMFDMFAELQNESQRLSQLVSFVNPSSIEKMKSLIDVSHLLIDSPNPPQSILQNQRWNSLGLDIVDIIETTKRFSRFKEKISNKYNIEIINSDIDPLLKNYQSNSKNKFFFIKPSFWKDRKSLKQYIIKNYKPKLKQIVEDLELLKTGKLTAEKIDKIADLGRELFGDLWRGYDTEWEQLDKFAQWIVKFRCYVIKKQFKDMIFDDKFYHLLDKENLRTSSEGFSNQLNQFNSLLDSLVQLAKIDEKQAFGIEIDKVTLEDIYNKVSNMKKTIDNVDLWIRFQGLLGECEEAGISDFVSKIISVKLPYEKITTTFICQFLKCWLSRVFSERPALKKFYGKDHEELMRKFCNIDMKQIELAKIRINHTLSGNVDTSWDVSDNSELGILLRESRKSRAHKPLRKLFIEIPHIITSLKPCLMMSPLTVAQFLDPNLLVFDLIIFDEASQIPPEDSLSPIMRGQQVVIAGDSRQLPPTTFFQSEVLTPDDEETDFDELVPVDLDSILDECAVIRFPKIMLRWHYRSRHESLIAFSNKSFYENRLNTFPCSDEENPMLGIKFHYFPKAHYDRGGSGSNVDEAMEVAKAVLRHFKETPDQSIGVGTFSIRQKYAIEDAIEHLLQEDNSLERFFTKDRYEHFFVKNLETIQGDERDVIFLSIGYGKDQNGKLSMNFGPLNKVGGDRRLNVLITRARLRVEVFSSTTGDDFDLSKTDSRGVHLLKKYLDFAEKGKEVLLREINPAIDEFSESPFEESVYSLLVTKGINVHKQVGCSGYRIDLAVVDDKKPGKYILGIECDGANYHSCVTARDRDRLRQQILEDLGWNIYRVWSTDWFNNPKRELERLLEAIDRAKEGTLKKKLQNNLKYSISYKDTLPASASQNIHELVPYSIAPVRKRGSSEEFYDASSGQIAHVIKRIVEVEGPIHQDEVERRTIQFWNLTFAGKRIKEQLEMVERNCSIKGLIKRRGKFYWPSDLKKPKVRMRDFDKINKDIELICPEEIGEAAIIVLKREYSMPKDELITQTAKLLGFGRITENINKYIGKSLKIYIKDNKVLKINERLTFNDEEDQEEEIAEEKTKMKVYVKKEKVKLCKKEPKEKPSEEPKEEDKKIKEFENIIKDSISNKTKIKINYYSPRKGFSTREIKPFYYDGIYIKAFCHLVNEDRTFRIDRVKKIVTKGIG